MTSEEERSTLVLTRQRIKKPKSDEEFIGEYTRLTPEEQNRWIELTKNLDTVEFERRLLGR